MTTCRGMPHTRLYQYSDCFFLDHLYQYCHHHWLLASLISYWMYNRFCCLCSAVVKHWERNVENKKFKELLMKMGFFSFAYALQVNRKTNFFIIRKVTVGWISLRIVVCPIPFRISRQYNQVTKYITAYCLL